MSEPNSAKVAEFHRVMGFPVRQRAELGSADERLLRLRLITEEVGELSAAMSANNLTETADALADLLYVVYGTAVQFGIPIELVFAEVHRSNLTKVGGGSDATGKALKPVHYQPPDIVGVLLRLNGIEPAEAQSAGVSNG